MSIGLLPRYVCVTLLSAVLAACAGSPRPSPPTSEGPALASPTPVDEQYIPAVVGIPEDTPASYTHRISAGDVLDVSVFQVEELSTQERVAPSGSVVLPLIGQVAVEGLTTEEAERRIESALGANYLQDPQVDIFVSEYANMRVTVGGQVKKAGVFPMTGTTSLMQAIALAGGTTDVADKKEVVVFRTVEGRGLNAYVINLEAIQAGQLSDPLLIANDKVLVPESGAKVFRKNAWDAVRGFVSFTAIPL